MTSERKTLPVTGDDDVPESAVVVAATAADTRTGAFFVHKDLLELVKPWEVEQHVGPARASERFGDVESWTDYIKRFSGASPDCAPLLTWNALGLHAIIDYHTGASGLPPSDNVAGRCQWTAVMPFVLSPEWLAWTGMANGRAVAQQKAVEFLEDHAPDIVAPPSADLLNLLRRLRTTVNKSAEVQVREDGTTHVEFSGDGLVAARGGTTDLPEGFTIGIPVLKGHVGADGKRVLYQLAVRLRASVDDQARLALRFSIPQAEATLEDVFADRVKRAQEMLGAAFAVLRAAD